MKKTPRETQTLRAGCSKAEPKIFAPTADPLSGARHGQNFIRWRWSLPLPKTQFGEDRCTQFRVIVVTDPQTHTNKPTDRTDYNTLIHCAAKLSAQCKKVLTKVRSKRIACDRFVSRKLFNRVNVPAACIEPIYVLYSVQYSAAIVRASGIRRGTR